MHRSLWLLAGAWAAVSLLAANDPNCGAPTREQFFAGHVKSVTEEAVGSDGGLEVISRSTFDRAGRLLEERHQVAGAGRSAYQVFRYLYQPRGRNYEIEVFGIDPAQPDKLNDLQRHLVRFDSRGRCVEERDIDSEGSLDQRKAYEYDGSGDLAREIDYNGDGSIFSTENRAYSRDHKLLSESAVENNTPELTSRWSREYRYDPYGNQTDVFFYREGVLEQRFISKYDARNRLVSYQSIVIDPKKDQHAYGCSDCGLSSGETTYTYDASGRLTELRSFQPGNKLMRVEKYSYDANGNLLPSADARYSFDSHGNWIKQVSVDGKSVSIVYRTIDYY